MSSKFRVSGKQTGDGIGGLLRVASRKGVATVWQLAGYYGILEI
jgi:hypothetical protein